MKPEANRDAGPLEAEARQVVAAVPQTAITVPPSSSDLSSPIHELVFETAAEHLSTLVPVVLPAATVDEVRRFLAGQRFDTVAEVAVCEDGRLRGLLSIEDLLAAAPEAVVAQLMDTDPPTVAPGLDQEKAAWKAVQHGEVSLGSWMNRGDSWV